MVTADSLDTAGISDADVRGLVVVDPSGHRLGEVRDVLIDGQTHHASLLSVVSGGILGMEPRELLVPVDAVTKIDERVHVLHLAATAAGRWGTSGDGSRP